MTMMTNNCEMSEFFILSLSLSKTRNYMYMTILQGEVSEWLGLFSNSRLKQGSGS